MNKYVLLAFLSYITAQAIFTAYFFVKGKNLSKITYTGKFTIGNKKNPKIKLYFSGDSVAAGVGATSKEESVAYKVAKSLSKNYYVILSNNAVSGFKVNDITKQKLEDNQDIIVLIISSNDLFYFTNIGNFKSQVQKMIELYRKKSKKLIVLGPLRVDTATSIPFFLRPIYYYDGFKYLKILENACSKFPNVFHTSSYYLKSIAKYGKIEGIDRFHPSNSGHSLYADMILNLINEHSFIQ